MSEMYAIISELDQESSAVVKNLLARLRDACGLRAIYDLHTPHFSWIVAESLDLESAKAILTDLAAFHLMLTSHVFGLGIFSGDRPVLYLPIAKSQAMIDLHNQIWNRLGSLADRANGYYSPAFWLPHITLAINDLRRENLACALESVAFEPVELTISVDNLILVVQKGNPPNNVLYQYRLANPGRH
ncbi:MAG: 2'-5' RNA ligase family protein [Brevefilum sp.]|nr:2'-5' RNA ligase family protein [Brevefilum sp.]